MMFTSVTIVKAADRIKESPDGYAFYDVAETMASDTLREVLLKNMPDKKKEKGYLLSLLATLFQYISFKSQRCAN